MIAETMPLALCTEPTSTETIPRSSANAHLHYCNCISLLSYCLCNLHNKLTAVVAAAVVQYILEMFVQAVKVIINASTPYIAY